MYHYACYDFKTDYTKCKNCGCHVISHGRNLFGRKYVHSWKTSSGNNHEEKQCKIHKCSVPEPQIKNQRIKV